MRFQEKVELSTDDVRRIREAEKVEKSLYSLHDSAWLSEDLRDFDYIFWNKFYGNARSIDPIDKSIGLFANYDTRVWKEFFSPNLKRDYSNCSYVDMHFKIATDTLNNSTGVKFSIYENKITRLSFGPFFSKDSEDYTEGLNDRLVFEIAKYFYSRKNQYEAVYKCLLKYEDEFANIYGEKFVKDLIVLFSVPIVHKEIPDFDFLKEVIKADLFCQRVIKNDIAWEMPTIQHSDLSSQFIWEDPSSSTTMYFENDHTIKVFSNYPDERITFSRGTSKFPVMRVNDALKQIIAFSNFGTEIYEKIKKRILVENI